MIDLHSFQMTDYLDNSDEPLPGYEESEEEEEEAEEEESEEEAEEEEDGE